MGSRSWTSSTPRLSHCKRSVLVLSFQSALEAHMQKPEQLGTLHVKKHNVVVDEIFSGNTYIGHASVQFLDQVSCWVDMKDDSAEIVLLSFLQEVIVSSSGIVRDINVHTHILTCMDTPIHKHTQPQPYL